MIIRLTVQDNDFTGMIRHYMDNFMLYLRTYMPEFEKFWESKEHTRNMYKMEKEISRLMNPNSDIVLTEKDKKIIIERIKYTFGVYVDNHFDSETSEYLKNNLAVKVLTRMEDKWENGEVYYWFQHADSYIVI